MNTLILMRHAQAERGGHDYDRPLSRAGREQATRQAAALVTEVSAVDLAIVSAATRTRQTARALLSGGLPIARVLEERSLYVCDWTGVLERIQRVPSEVGTLLVIGHEPTISLTARLLTAPTSPIASQLGVGFSTAMAAVGEAPQWSEVDRSSVRMVSALRAPLTR